MPAMWHLFPQSQLLYDIFAPSCMIEKACALLLHKPAIHAPLNHEISLIILIFLFSLVNDIERFCDLLRIEIVKYNGRVKYDLEIPIYHYCHSHSL